MMGLNGEGGMSTAKKLDTDYSEYLGFLRFVLSVTERGGSNGLADWINTKPKAGARNAYRPLQLATMTDEQNRIPAGPL